jgi:hypothetical protein
MRVTLALSVAAVLGLGASAASAQGSPDGFVFGSVRFQPDLSMRPDQQKPKIPEPKPKSPPSARSQPRATQPATPAFTISGVVDLGLVSFASAQPIEALYDTANGLMWGGGVRVAHRSGLFARVTAYHFSKQGERVFVSSGSP